MAAFDLIIFDLDGVLVDSERLSCGCLQQSLAGLGIEIGLGEVYERFLGRGFQAVAEQYRQWRGTALPDDFRARLEAAVRAAFAAALKPMPGIRDLLASLRTPYCLASSSDRARIALSLELAGLSDRFAGRVFGAEAVAHGKPAPDLFLHAARAMGAAPERCLVVEDSGPGIAAGRAAGMTVWGFAGGSHLAGNGAEQRLRASGAARVFAKMDDLQRALAA
ncbi:MAG TPA: HAD family hydrolase [Dongiaceae bacterium]|jgi:HAD superfamily hydrolase (TIGR01509 family)|nr:HAD family hydrolase [Dongiaceae bacterium]